MHGEAFYRGPVRVPRRVSAWIDGFCDFIRCFQSIDSSGLAGCLASILGVVVGGLLLAKP